MKLLLNIENESLYKRLIVVVDHYFQDTAIRTSDNFKRWVRWTGKNDSVDLALSSNSNAGKQPSKDIILQALNNQLLQTIMDEISGAEIIEIRERNL